jgi:ferritin-like protein
VFIGTDDEVRGHEEVPPLTRRERNRAAAWELAKQAADAARSEDCTRVQALAPRIRDLDTELHLAVFMRDAAIQRCLGGH